MDREALERIVSNVVNEENVEKIKRGETVVFCIGSDVRLGEIYQVMSYVGQILKKHHNLNVSWMVIIDEKARVWLMMFDRSVCPRPEISLPEEPDE